MFMMPFKSIFDYTLKHFELLPINWFIGATTIALVTSFTNKVLPLKNTRKKYIAAGLIVFNSCFIDGIVHLYRDGLVCLILISCCIFIYNRKYIKSLILSIGLGLLRGANGIIALLYIIIDCIRMRYKLSRRIFILVSFIGIIIVSVSFNSLGIEKYARSFSNSSGESMTMNERLTTFYGQENTQGGVIKLLKSSNPIYKLIAIPIYMLSPFKMGSLYITHFYSIRTTGWHVTRLRIESIWEGLNIIFYAPLYISLIVGIVYWFKEQDTKKLVILFVFLITLILVTLISMQTRHKMAFIIFFPLIYSFFLNYSSVCVRNQVKKYNIYFVLLIIIYNLL